MCSEEKFLLIRNVFLGASPIFVVRIPRKPAKQQQQTQQQDELSAGGVVAASTGPLRALPFLSSPESPKLNYLQLAKNHAPASA